MTWTVSKWQASDSNKNTLPAKTDRSDAFDLEDFLPP